MIEMARKGSGWHDESRRHSLARRGVRTVIDDKRRLPVNRYVARGIKYIGEGPSMHGYLDRSYDSYLFRDSDGEQVEVIVFTEPDFDSLKHIAEEENMTDGEYMRLVDDAIKEFNKPGGGEVVIIWAGAEEFTGTADEFAEKYPELNRHLGLGNVWNERPADPRSTLRGHAPQKKWIHGVPGDESGIIEIFKMTSGKGKGRYFVEFWEKGKSPIESKSFDNYEDAIKFAKEYMNK